MVILNWMEVFIIYKVLMLVVVSEVSVCTIKHQRDPTHDFRFRWVITRTKEDICNCTQVDLETLKCSRKYTIPMPFGLEYFYVDDPHQLVNTKDPYVLQVLLGCLTNPATWGEWAFWTDCAVTCGNGTRMRSNECLNSDFPELSCEGEQTREDEGCNHGRCPTWGEWAFWSDCSVTCGNGTRMRSKQCLNSDFLEISCVGEQPRENQSCSHGKCPTWGKWSGWNDCSAVCGKGTQMRSKECLNTDFPILSCEGVQPKENKTCSHGMEGSQISLNGKPTSQSSTYSGGLAERAVDGNTNGYWLSRSCTHTSADVQPWWMVDLEFTQCIGKVELFNRVDCCANRLNGAIVRVGPNADLSNTACGTVTSQQITTSQKIEVFCEVMGRYLSVHLPNPVALTLCEVRAFTGSCNRDC